MINSDCTEQQQHPFRTGLFPQDKFSGLLKTPFAMIRGFTSFHSVVNYPGEDELVWLVGNLLVQHVVFFL